MSARMAIGVKFTAALVIAAALDSMFAVNAAPVSVPLDRLRACLTIEDMTKERLDCFDAIVPPEPKSVTAKPSAVAECRFYREEDERLRCFNGFLVARARSAPQPAPASTPQIPPNRFRPCHALPEMTKERLDCFDAIVPPAPKAFTAQPRSIFECRFYREQDDRLRCYVNFAARLFANVRSAPPPAPPPAVRLPTATRKHVRAGRGGCGSRGGAGYRTKSGKCASRRR